MSLWETAQDLAEGLAQACRPVTVAHVRQRMSDHDWWCAADHRCTAHPHLGYPSGEHRSKVQTWNTPYGELNISRSRTHDKRRTRLKVIIDVILDADEQLARRQAQHLAVGFDLTARAVMKAGPPPELASVTALTAADRRALPWTV